MFHESRFDDKQLLTEAIVTLLNRGVEPDDLGLVLSRVGPVDLDLMQICLAEILAYNNALMQDVQIAA
ncbi:hypothetical protein ACFO1V_14460 [Daeguia caeni]|uniref:Uncharacterized protein n=1 Tax=Daeguia caeni TaxID=439612 RepID=A0ABV9H806_9HYPH